MVGIVVVVVTVDVVGMVVVVVFVEVCVTVHEVEAVVVDGVELVDT